MPVVSNRAMLALALTLLVGVVTLGALGRGAHSETSVLEGNAPASVMSKTTEVAVPLKDGEFNLGDVAVRIATDNSVSINRASLLSSLARILRKEVVDALQKDLPTEEFVSTAQISTAGLICSYNPVDLEVLVQPKVEQRPRGEITGSFSGSAPPSDSLSKAALVSGYVNAHLGIDMDRRPDVAPAQFEFPSTAVDGAVRFGGVVLEGEADTTWDGKTVRRGTRLVYDLPDEAVRMRAGDLTSSPGSSRILPPVLGISVEKSFQKLQPTKNIRPTGKRSFRVERPSQVEVLVNGRALRHLRLTPGEYDLDDLPLAAGNNNIQLIIKDETGREEKVDFSVLFDRSLLAQGVSEWAFTAGLQSGFDERLTYDYSGPLGGAHYRRGLAENVTGEMHIGADDETVNSGLGVLLQTSLGLLALDGIASVAKDGAPGWSLVADMELASDPVASRPPSSLHLGVEVDSKTFTALASEKALNEQWLRLRGAYSRDFGTDITGSLSAHYALAREGGENAFGVGVSASRALGDGLSMSVSGGYDTNKEKRLDSLDNLPGLTIFARLNYRLSSSSHLDFGYDWTGREARTSVGTSAGNGAGSWSAELELTRDASEGKPTANSLEGSFGYKGNRFELSTSHSRDFNRRSGLQHEHSSANLGTALAFADGRFAMGRPIQNSFALIDIHPSLKDSKLRVSPSENGDIAASDFLGPAVLPDISAYSHTRVPYDVEDLPPGYDLGSGAFDFLAQYKSGYRVSVGSGFAVTLMGKLLDASGEPLQLLAGSAYAKENPERKVTFFSNEAGRFGAQGFGPGEWILEVSDSTPIRYTVTVPPEAAGVVDVGDLQPIQ